MKARLALAASILTLPACASIYPQGDSLAPEIIWDVLQAADTAQTARLSHYGLIEADPMAALVYGTRHPKPAEVYAVNIALAIGHGAVSAWLDRKVDQADKDDSDNLGLWYTARFAWHAFSILGTGSSVVHNYGLGVHP